MKFLIKNKPRNFWFDLQPRKAAKLTSVLLTALALQVSAAESSKGLVLTGKNITVKEKTTTQSNLIQKKITGKVTNEKGETLPGVNVVVKGTKISTQTGLDGNFTIEAPDNAVLIVTYVGFLKQEVTVNGRTVLNIVLKDDTTQLNEIVVVGYETVRKREVTGSVSRISGAAVKNSPAASVESAFQGKLAGVQVQQSSGQPGSAIQVRVRGFSSIGAGSDPLYIIDGVPTKSGSFGSLAIGPDRYDGNVGTNALGDLNPNDIQSIEVLKDASEAAIYGARASNGVVLITTKKGKKGPTKFNVELYSGDQSITRTLPLLNKEEFLKVSEDMVRNAGMPVTRPNLVYTSAPLSQDGNTNWQDQIFRNAKVSSFNVSARGGSDDVTYSASLGYFDQDGIIVNTGYKRASSRFNLDFKANDKLNLGVNMAYSFSYRKGTDEGPRQNGVIYRGLRNVPTQEVYDSQGNYNPGIPFSPNVRQVAEESIFDTRTNRTNVNVFANYQLTKGLTFRTNLAADVLSLRQDNFFPGTLAFSNNRESVASHSQDVGWINENVLNYKTTINSNHHVGLLGGISFQRNRTELLVARANNAATDAVYTVNAGATLLQASSSITTNSIASYFGKAKYDYKGKYFLAATARVDGSSRFGSGNKYGTFPSVSAAWDVSQEDFWKSSVIDNLKFRTSWGQTGNQNIDNFVAQGLYLPGYNYAGTAGIATAPNGLPNSGLTWETTTQANTGVDLSLFGGRLSLSADYWTKNTKDLLFQVALPNTSGYESIVTNIGEVENKGIDFQLGATILKKGDFSWNSDFNISFMNNKVKKLPGGNDIQQTERYLFGGVIGILREGESLGSFYLYQSNGVFSTSAEAAAAGYIDKISTVNGGQPQAGDARWVDQNGDGVINTKDKIIAGNPIPKFTGGFNNTFKYKGLSLEAFFQFSEGNDVFNLFRGDLARGYRTNYLKETLNAWKQEGDITNVPRNVLNDPANNTEPVVFRPSTRFLEDGSFIKLKTVTLTYDFPSSLLEKLKLSDLKIYVKGTNLLTLTKYTGFDPEVSVSQNNNAGQNGGFQFGIDRGLYPLSKSVTIGVSLDF
jgi:TonB-linked SusC/RagA family outer membrane protein